LGAFIMGTILAETLEAEMIHKLTTPIKNLFGAVFFVSVGMMVNPAILLQYWWQILIITVVVVVLKSISSGVGMLLSGDNLRNSVRAGMCFGQIGEFSFIIATVGISFGVIDDFLYPIIVSVSIITTFLTPYMIKAGDPLFNWLDRKIPENWTKLFGNKEKTIKSKTGTFVTMRTFVRSQVRKTVLYSAILLALSLVCFSIFAPWKTNNGAPWVSIVCLAITLLVVVPFVWALAFKRDYDPETLDVIKKNKACKLTVRLLFGMRFLVAWFFTSYIFRHFLDSAFWSSVNLQMNDILMAIVASLAFILLLRTLSPAMKWYERIERRFLENMNKRQTLQTFVVPEVLRENFTLERMTLSPHSSYVGKRIRDCEFREKYNIIVVGVDRADEATDLPRRDFLLYPMDEIVFLGTEEHLAQLRPLVEVEEEVLVRERPMSDVNIHCATVDGTSKYVGVSLRESDLLNQFNTLIIAVERDGQFILNPSASIVFQEGDTVWFVASEEHTRQLLASN